MYDNLSTKLSIYGRGLYYQYIDYYEEALACFRAVSVENENYYYAQYNIATIYLYLNQYESAIELVTRMLDNHNIPNTEKKSFKIIEIIGSALTGKLKDALSQLKTTTGSNKEEEKFLKLLYSIYYQINLIKIEQKQEDIKLIISFIEKTQNSYFSNIEEDENSLAHNKIFYIHYSLALASVGAYSAASFCLNELYQQVCKIDHYQPNISVSEIDGGYKLLGVSCKDALNLLKNNLLQIEEILVPIIKKAILQQDFLDYLQKRIPDIESLDLQKIKDKQDIISVYIDYEINEKQISEGWANPAILQAIAKIKGIELYMWQFDEDGELIPHLHKQYAHYTPDQTSHDNRVDLVFIDEFRFERLELNKHLNTSDNCSFELEKYIPTFNISVDFEHKSALFYLQSAQNSFLQKDYISTLKNIQEGLLLYPKCRMYLSFIEQRIYPLVYINDSAAINAFLSFAKNHNMIVLIQNIRNDGLSLPISLDRAILDYCKVLTHSYYQSGQSFMIDKFLAGSMSCINKTEHPSLMNQLKIQQFKAALQLGRYREASAIYDGILESKKTSSNSNDAIISVNRKNTTLHLYGVYLYLLTNKRDKAKEKFIELIELCNQFNQPSNHYELKLLEALIQSSTTIKKDVIKAYQNIDKYKNNENIFLQIKCLIKYNLSEKIIKQYLNHFIQHFDEDKRVEYFSLKVLKKLNLLDNDYINKLDRFLQKNPFFLDAAVEKFNIQMKDQSYAITQDIYNSAEDWLNKNLNYDPLDKICNQIKENRFIQQAQLLSERLVVLITENYKTGYYQQKYKEKYLPAFVSVLNLIVDARKLLLSKDIKDINVELLVIDLAELINSDYQGKILWEKTETELIQSLINVFDGWIKLQLAQKVLPARSTALSIMKQANTSYSSKFFDNGSKDECLLNDEKMPHHFKLYFKDRLLESLEEARVLHRLFAQGEYKIVSKSADLAFEFGEIAAANMAPVPIFGNYAGAGTTGIKLFKHICFYLNGISEQTAMANIAKHVSEHHHVELVSEQVAQAVKIMFEQQIKYLTIKGSGDLADYMVEQILHYLATEQGRHSNLIKSCITSLSKQSKTLFNNVKDFFGAENIIEERTAPTILLMLSGLFCDMKSTGEIIIPSNKPQNIYGSKMHARGILMCTLVHAIPSNRYLRHKNAHDDDLKFYGCIHVPDELVEEFITVLNYRVVAANQLSNLLQKDDVSSTDTMLAESLKDNTKRTDFIGKK